MTTKIEILKDIKVVLSLTARDWELFDDMYGVDAAADRLNRAVEEAIADNDNPTDAMDAALPAFEELSKFGASDSEPRWHLINILRKTYANPDFERW